MAVGKDEGSIGGVEIVHHFTKEDKVDTITIYLSIEHQKMYYNKIIEAKPRRIIFNPGAENPELEKLARKNNIQFENACTLVMLNSGQY